MNGNINSSPRNLPQNYAIRGEEEANVGTFCCCSSRSVQRPAGHTIVPTFIVAADDQQPVPLLLQLTGLYFLGTKSTLVKWLKMLLALSLCLLGNGTINLCNLSHFFFRLHFAVIHQTFSTLVEAILDGNNASANAGNEENTKINFNWKMQGAQLAHIMINFNWMLQAQISMVFPQQFLHLFYSLFFLLNRHFSSSGN
jgi:hypothetical protein